MEIFGKLTVVRSYKVQVGKYDRLYCDCVCTCGKTRTVRLDRLIGGKAIMCKVCAGKERAKKNTKHGMCGTRQHRIWVDMKQRCYNKKNTAYMYYGAKGVTICDEWMNSFLSFNQWLSENGYNDKMTVDRINPDEMYCPKNCRLITQSENTILAHLGKKYVRRSATYGKRFE